jgi:hypothetical protein
MFQELANAEVRMGGQKALGLGCRLIGSPGLIETCNDPPPGKLARIRGTVPCKCERMASAPDTQDAIDASMAGLTSNPIESLVPAA